MDTLSVALIGGALAILATTVNGAREARRARALNRDLDAYLDEPPPPPEATSEPERPSDDDPVIARLDAAITRLRLAHDASPSQALRDLAISKINEAQGRIIERMAEARRANNVSLRARMARHGR